MDGYDSHPFAGHHVRNAATAASLVFLTAEELAGVMRFPDGPDSKFRRWVRQTGIEPVPGRPHLFDAHLVRERLNALQGIVPSEPTSSKPIENNLTELRRMRRATKT
ncbi:hypothetical protein NHN26_14220 [Rhodovulum tesquicola]|uniref:hypothetical protein n=1 Tax=Rhodovulum tesquicola TaxID=540254 RepID=UPI002097C879|nr:hypothetical protein [Rhodovulum tesquicola]MCO8146380.1 hypothetical protein [Rhodovulum tesquicola]